MSKGTNIPGILDGEDLRENGKEFRYFGRVEETIIISPAGKENILKLDGVPGMQIWMSLQTSMRKYTKNGKWVEGGRDKPYSTPSLIKKARARAKKEGIELPVWNISVTGPNGKKFQTTCIPVERFGFVMKSVDEKDLKPGVDINKIEREFHDLMKTYKSGNYKPNDSYMTGTTIETGTMMQTLKDGRIVCELVDDIPGTRAYKRKIAKANKELHSNNSILSLAAEAIETTNNHVAPEQSTMDIADDGVTVKQLFVPTSLQVNAKNMLDELCDSEESRAWAYGAKLDHAKYVELESKYKAVMALLSDIVNNAE